MDFDKRLKIRGIYKNFNPEINGRMVSPYDLGIDWMDIFTPIEDNVWHDIRYLGLPLYPQFPVGKYFVDFGDPIRKIAVEVDSFKWHKDTEKDLIREKEIEKIGWNVFRIMSYQTKTTKWDFMDDDGDVHPKYFIECSEGILAKIYTDCGYLR